MKQALEAGDMSINKAYQKTKESCHRTAVSTMRGMGVIGPCGKCSCCKAWKKKIAEEKAKGGGA